MRQKEKEVELKERDVQTILAAHLFEPLMSGSQIMVDKNSYMGTDDIICPGPGCSKKVRIENTSFGKWYCKWMNSPIPPPPKKKEEKKRAPMAL